jgi:uncharacterized membrane protein YedE/YeeE
MTIDWNAFTPWSALAGGVLIGIAAAMFALLNGRIAGISGVIGGLLRPTACRLRHGVRDAASARDLRRTLMLVIAAAMLLGMGIFELAERRNQAAAVRAERSAARPSH